MLRVTQHGLRVAVVLVRRKRRRRGDRELTAERPGARERRLGWVNGEELGGRRGAVPAPPQEHYDTQDDQPDEDEPSEYAACDGTRVGRRGKIR